MDARREITTLLVDLWEKHTHADFRREIAASASEEALWARRAEDAEAEFEALQDRFRDLNRQLSASDAA